MLDILSTVEVWLQQKQPVALATVVGTWGSAPRRPGAKMGVNEQMGMTGSVSGGCVETAVVQEALDTLADHKTRLLNFGVSDDVAWDVGLACGGKISVLVEALDTRWWELVRERVQKNLPFKTVTVVTGEFAGQKTLVNEGDILYSTANPEIQDALVRAAAQQAKTTQTTVNELDVLVDVYQPAPRLIIVGGAHTAIALKNMAHLLGFRVVIIDPRSAFSTPERFPDVEAISHQYPDKALPAIGLNDDTYIALLTHDPKIDDPALRVALPSPARYIGILSSKRTHEQRIERLTAAGIDRELMDKRIHTPIGIDIGAQTPEEIALCIMAEIVAVRNGALT